MLQAEEHKSKPATARSRAPRLPDLDEREFRAWSGLLERRVGLFIAPERRSFLVSGIRSRMRDTGCRNYGEYYRKLESDHFQVQEWTLLVDLLTVHETCFFRHRQSLRLVQELILPEVFADRSNFNAWSVGCASGEEAWSLAMMVDHYCELQERPLFYGVTGTDISLPALRQARKAVYLKRRLADISESFRQRYCRSVSGQHFSISEYLRKRVRFAQLNLRDIDQAPFHGLDLIFCQNVLIYFDREQRQYIADHFADCLRPGGLLILGPGELVGWKNLQMDKVRYEDTLAYRRSNREHPVDSAGQKERQ